MARPRGDPDPRVTPVGHQDWSACLDTLCAQVIEYYVFPDVGEQVVAVLRERQAAGAYDAITDDEAFAAAVTADLQSVNGDKHLRLLYSVDPIPEHEDERIHDLTASVESIIAPSATRLFIMYKLNTGFATANDTTPSALHNVRFNVQVNQSLPFLSFMNANWEMLVAVTNLFRDDMLDGSVYDELFVVAPPKRVLGGVTMRF